MDLPVLRDESIMLNDSESILREGEKAPNTDFRKTLALDYKQKIKIIDEVAYKMRDIKAKGLAHLTASIN